MKLLLLTITIAAASASLSQAAPLTLLNADFTTQGATDNELESWVDLAGDSGSLERIYHLDLGEGIANGGAGATSAAAAFQARNGNTLQQNFLTSEATADTFGLFTISFDSGWRNNSASPNDLSLRVSIWNVTDDTELGFSTYTFPPDSPANLFDTYQTIGNQSLEIVYNPSAAGLSGDEIALRFTVETTQNGFNPTAWIDNIVVDASSTDEPFNIIMIERSGSMVTLTWDSNEDEQYAISLSTDLNDWDREIDDSISPDPGDFTTKTFDLASAGVEAEEALFFRVEKVQQ